MRKILLAACCCIAFGVALGQSAPSYYEQYTGVAFTENSSNAVQTVMPPHSATYSTLAQCSADGFQSAWGNSFPFLASGLTGQVAGICTPVQTSFGASNALMVISLVGPNRPLWQLSIPFATQALCQSNIASLAALQAFLGTFLSGPFNNLLPWPTALGAGSLTTQAQYSSPDIGGGTDNVTVACPPGGPP